MVTCFVEHPSPLRAPPSLSVHMAFPARLVLGGLGCSTKLVTRDPP